MSKPNYIDMYFCDFNDFPVGPSFASLAKRSNAMKALLFWKRWWIRTFKPELWADTVIRYQVVEQIIREESEKAWVEGCEIKWADHENGLQLEIGKADIGGNC